MKTLLGYIVLSIFLHIRPDHPVHCTDLACMMCMGVQWQRIGAGFLRREPDREQHFAQADPHVHTSSISCTYIQGFAMLTYGQKRNQGDCSKLPMLRLDDVISRNESCCA